MNLTPEQRRRFIQLLDRLDKVLETKKQMIQRRIDELEGDIAKKEIVYEIDPVNVLKPLCPMKVAIKRAQAMFN